MRIKKGFLILKQKDMNTAVVYTKQYFGEKWYSHIPVRDDLPLLGHYVLPVDTVLFTRRNENFVVFY